MINEFTHKKYQISDAYQSNYPNYAIIRVRFVIIIFIVIISTFK